MCLIKKKKEESLVDLVSRATETLGMRDDDVPSPDGGQGQG
jgi:hypothetical protein